MGRREGAVGQGTASVLDYDEPQKSGMPANIELGKEDTFHLQELGEPSDYQMFRYFLCSLHSLKQSVENCYWTAIDSTVKSGHGPACLCKEIGEK